MKLIHTLTLALLASATLAAEPFTLLIYETPSSLAARTDSARAAAYWGQFAALGKQLQDAGILRGGAPFHTGDAIRTVRVRSGKTQVSNGPAAPSPAPLGGYFVIDVDNIDKAIEWAARVPAAASAAVEVRAGFPSPAMKP
jgi:hypothetical protein